IFDFAKKAHGGNKVVSPFVNATVTIHTWEDIEGQDNQRVLYCSDRLGLSDDQKSLSATLNAGTNDSVDPLPPPKPAPFTPPSSGIDLQKQVDVQASGIRWKISLIINDDGSMSIQRLLLDRIFLNRPPFIFKPTYKNGLLTAFPKEGFGSITMSLRKVTI